MQKSTREINYRATLLPGRRAYISCDINCLLIATMKTSVFFFGLRNRRFISRLLPSRCFILVKAHI